MTMVMIVIRGTVSMMEVEMRTIMFEMVTISTMPVLLKRPKTMKVVVVMMDKDEDKDDENKMMMMNEDEDKDDNCDDS